MFISILLSVLFLTLTTSASVKREEFSGSSSGANSPVYSPSASSSYLSPSSSSASSGGSGSSNNANSYLNGPYNYGAQPSSNDHLSSASSNSYQNQQPGGSQGNLYYYYYPVQEKPKDLAFQASASNQYSSSVTPNNGDSSVASDGSATSNGQDLSYSAQGESYNVQGLGGGEGYASQAQGGQSGNSNNYDQSLSNIASQLQQYGYGSGSGGNAAYSPSASQYSGPSSVYGQGTSYGLSGDGSGNPYSGAGSSLGAGASGSVGGSGLSASTYPGLSDPSSVYSNLASLQGYNNPYGQSSPYSPQSSPYGPYGSFGNYASGSAPQPSYEPATSSSSSSGLRKYGIGSIIMPMLALAGLSLLIPTVTSLTTAAGRKKRSVDPAKDAALGDYLERIDRYYALYKTAVERDECMNRIICELGDSMGFVRGRSSLLNFAEKFTPLWLSKRIGALKSAASTNDKPGKCKKYSCQ